jgi:phosphatidylserine/phosphatidylglycerophosphate/cardiolipin synthase-like enzyme
MTDPLVSKIRQLVIRSPLRLLEQVCLQLDVAADWQHARSRIIPLLPSSDLSDMISQIFVLGQALNYLPNQLAFALRSAAEVEKHHRQTQQIELVWTGPEPSRFALRRIDEALLQLIAGAKETLVLMSFASYPVDRLSLALQQAIKRGVRAKFFLEMDTNKVASTTPPVSINEDIANVRLYTWADEYRSRTTTNKYGTLHAKAAIADSSCLLISSANLTEHAMSLNMELGLMVTGGELPQKLDQLLTDFVELGVFVEAN